MSVLAEFRAGAVDVGVLTARGRCNPACVPSTAIRMPSQTAAAPRSRTLFSLCCRTRRQVDVAAPRSRRTQSILGYARHADVDIVFMNSGVFRKMADPSGAK